MDWNLVLRLVIAGLLGGFVGLERELRAKEAGLRTHFIVALGSALFMIISEFSFTRIVALFEPVLMSSASVWTERHTAPVFKEFAAPYS